MDYRDTVHLPKTGFPMRAALSEREPAQVKAWEDGGVYQKLLAKNAKAEKFVFHDGPPYANGAIHQGHFLNKILKDLVVKYHLMAGHLTDFVPGWDCHGLPIERQVDKVLGAKKRELLGGRVPPRLPQVRPGADRPAAEGLQAPRHLRPLGPSVRDDGFPLRGGHRPRAGAARPARRALPAKAPGALVLPRRDRAGRGGGRVRGQDQPLHLRALPGHLRRAFRAWGARDLDHHALDIPANLAITANPDLEYVAYDLPRHGVTVVAKDLLHAFLKDCAPEELTSPGNRAARICSPRRARPARRSGTPSGSRSCCRAASSQGWKYRHPLVDRESPVVLGAHATAEAGTGLVHTAPGHGEDDFHMGVQYGLPIWAPVDGARPLHRRRRHRRSAKA